MTCIVGLQCDDGVYIGADSAISDAATMLITFNSPEKVFQNGLLKIFV